MLGSTRERPNAPDDQSTHGLPLRIACLIPGKFESPYAEGLFQYLTFFLYGLAPGQVAFSLVVSHESTFTFESWRDCLAVEKRDDVAVVAAPASLTTIGYPAAVASEAREWLANFEASIDVWFSIRPDLIFLSATNKPVVSVFADFLFAAFPTLYRMPVFDVKGAFDTIQHVIPHVSRFICFSEHVKQTQLLSFFDVEADRVSVIPHASFDYRTIVGVDFPDKASAAKKIRDYLQTERPWRDPFQEELLGRVLKNFPFEEVDFVFVSTRARPHKNVPILVRAIEELRKSYRNIKVIVTSPVRWEPLPDTHTGKDMRDDLSRAITAAGLQWDIISLAHLPFDVHAALYKCAAVTVHPSPFEGGFPFTAFESLSMGTPILIADGEVARESLAPSDRPSFFFNPTSAKDLATRIVDAIDGRDRMVEQQSEILQRFPRTLALNSADILDICRLAATELPSTTARPEDGFHKFGDDSIFEAQSKGWAPAEPWGRWTVGPSATLSFWLDPERGPSRVELRLSVPLAGGTTTFVGRVSLKGSRSAVPIDTDGSEGPVSAVLENVPGGLVEIEVRTRTLIRPCDFVPASSDDRHLGFGLLGMSISRMTPGA